MKAVVFCSVYRETLLPVNENVPDCLTDICGETPLGICERALSAVTDELPALIVGRGSAHVSLSLERPHRLIVSPEDLGGTLAELAGGESLLLAEADSAEAPDFAALLRGASSLVSGCTVLVSRTGNGLPLRTADRKLTELSSDFLSKNTDCNGFLTGAALLSAELAARLGSFDFSDLPELLSALLAEDERISAVYTDLPCRKLLTPEDYRLACLSAAGDSAHVIGGVTVVPPVSVGRGSVVGEGSVLDGCVIGENVSVGRRCVLKNCVIGESSQLSAGTSVSSSVIGSACEIGANVSIGEGCAVGSRTHIGCGSEVEATTKLPSSSRIGELNCVGRHGAVGVLLDESGAFTSGNSSAAECAVRFASAVASQLEAGNCVVLGHGEGEAARTFASAAAGGLSASGVMPLDVGECPQTAVTYLITRLGAAAGCYVTAEGQLRISVISKGGLPLTEKTRCGIGRAYAFRLTRTVPLTEQPALRCMFGAIELYRSYLRHLLPERLDGVNPSVRCAFSGVERLADSLLKDRRDLSAERTVFDISNDGMACTAFSSATGLLTHEQLILIASAACFSREQAVSLPSTFPTAADTVAERFGGTLYRYSSSCGTSDTARETAQRPDNFFVRDALALVCMICAHLSQSGTTLARAAGSLPEFATVRRFVPTDMTAAEMYALLGAEREDGCGVVTAMGGRAALTPSADRSGLMIFAEAASSETASALCEDIIRRLSSQTFP